MATINFQDPRLQRSRQKMAALGPESKAIFDTAAETGAFAENEAIKQLKMMRIGNELQTRRDVFNLRQKERLGDLKMAKKQYAFGKDQGKKALLISGLGIIPKAYMGYQAYKQSGQSASDILQLAKEIQAQTAGLKIGG